MIVTLIIDQYGSTYNGTTVTAMSLANELKALGHEVRIVTTSKIDEDNVYQVKVNKLPILYQLCKLQGMLIARSNKKVLEAAIKGSGLVHCFLPFPLQKKALKIARKYNIPVTAGFHLQPENITYTIHLEKFKWLNKLIYYYFRMTFYRHIKYIHCPSNMIKDQLILHNYQGVFHVVSNGYNPIYKPLKIDKPNELKDKFIILMIGRYSREKRQDLIIKAVKESKYEKDIQLIFAGKGPWYKKLKKLSNKLINKPILNFYEKDELIQVINYSDLYIHASDAEIEGISCIEAFACGLVPIISDSKLSATNQFALTTNNLFEAGNYLSLRDKIDFFIENKDQLSYLKDEYINLAKSYDVKSCTHKLIEMFNMAINDNK
ncbi:TPA: glycosyltransferase family 4 protein [bacterium]|nr:glycosyltransferase family 4 protein [bacterium]